jgi:SAM-dependent methyltransferase
MHGVARDWFASTFNALYPVVYAHRTVASAGVEARFAAAQLALGPADRVLDLCCGNGRHLAHLLQYTPRAVGLDYSTDLLRLARANCGPEVRLVRGDMRALPFAGPFDAVANFFTSFGYFESEPENEAVVAGVARALRADGRFFIDYFNAAHLRRNLVSRSERRQAEFDVIEERWIDETARRVNKRTMLLCRGNLVSTTGESVRMYTFEELAGMLARAGLEVTQTFGNFAGAPLGDAYPRMILAGRKAARP